MATTDTDKPTTKPAPAAATKGKPFIVIYNHASAFRVLSLRGHIASASRTYVPGGTIKLNVGATIVSRALWERWKGENKDVEIDGIERRGQASILLTDTIPTTSQREEGEGKPWLMEGPEIGSEKNPLAGLDDKQARELIGYMLDEPTLKKWLPLVAESRRGIAAIIAERLEQFRRANAAGKPTTFAA